MEVTARLAAGEGVAPEERAQELTGWDAERQAAPSPATNSILGSLKAGESVFYMHSG